MEFKDPTRPKTALLLCVGRKRNPTQIIQGGPKQEEKLTIQTVHYFECVEISNSDLV
jgi:hypothetical protein